MGTVINGRDAAQKLREELKDFVDLRVKSGLRPPAIATIVIGHDGGSLSYVNNQKKICTDIGINARVIILEESIAEEQVLSEIEMLNMDNDIDGIMLQLPLPAHLNERKIISSIDYKKDVDGLTDINTGRFYNGQRSFIPCTPQSVIALIKSTGIKIEGKSAVVIGRSNIVGKPVAQLLLNENATTTICHSRTVGIKEICAKADIVVCAIGKPGFLTADFIKEGSIIIDVGTTMVNGKLTGDVKFDEVIQKADYATPVPGGVGAMTTTMLLKNVCEALKNNVY